MMEEIPVYLFTGFLDAGKTKFIQETLEDPRFNSGESTLLLLCEEGEEEYEPTTFSGKNVFIETVRGAGGADPPDLEACRRSTPPSGWWWSTTHVDAGPALPEHAGVLDRLPGVLLRRCPDLPVYNTNMRGLVVDKLKSCEMVVLNRADETVDKVEIHKIIRAVSRRTNIAYEDRSGEVYYYDDTPTSSPMTSTPRRSPSPRRTSPSGTRTSPRSRRSTKGRPCTSAASPWSGTSSPQAASSSAAGS